MIERASGSGSSCIETVAVNARQELVRFFWHDEDEWSAKHYAGNLVVRSYHNNI